MVNNHTQRLGLAIVEWKLKTNLRSIHLVIHKRVIMTYLTNYQNEICSGILFIMYTFSLI